jgi:hypothetical protein
MGELRRHGLVIGQDDGSARLVRVPLGAEGVERLLIGRVQYPHSALAGGFLGHHQVAEVGEHGGEPQPDA